MAKLGELSVVLSAKTAKFVKEIQNSTKKLDDFSEAAQGVAKKAGLAFGAMAGSMALVARAADQQRQAELKLAGAIRGTGEAIDIDKIKNMASALQRVSTVGDETTISQAGLLVGFGATEKQVLSLMPRIADLSAMLGKDMQSVTMAFGQALQGNASMLRRYGVNLSDAEREAFKMASSQERMTILLERSAYAQGQASNAAKTAVGSYKQMSNAIGDVFEQMGFIIDADLGKAFGLASLAISKAGDALRDTHPELKKTYSAIVLTSAALFASTGLIAGMSALALKVPAVTGVMTALSASMMSVFLRIVVIAGAISALIAGIGAFAKLKDYLGVGKGSSPTPKRGFGSGVRRVGRDVGVFPESTSPAVGSKTTGVSVKDVINETIGKPFMESFMKGLDVAGITSVVTKMKDAVTSLEKELTETKKAAKAANTRLNELGGKPAEETYTPFSKDRPPVGKVAPSGYVDDALAAPFTPWWEETNIPNWDAGARMPGPSSQMPANPGEWGEAFKGIGDEIGNNLQGFLSGVGNTLLQGMQEHSKEFSEFVGAIVQGAQAGGVGGAIGAGVGKLMTSTERFGEQMRFLDSAIAPLVEIMEPFMRNLDPFIVLIRDIVGVLGQFLKPLLGLLAVALNAIIVPLRLVVGVGMLVASGLGRIVNGFIDLVDMVLSVVEFLAKLVKQSGAVKALREQLEGAKVDVDTMQKNAEDMISGNILDANNAASGAIDAFKDVATESQNAAQEIGESMKNIPPIFKTAMRRWQSVELSAFEPGMEIDRDAIASESPVTISQMNVSVGDPQEFIESIETIWETTRSQQNGSSQSQMDQINTMPIFGFGSS